MTFDAPSPGAFAGGLAEDRDEVFFGIAFFASLGTFHLEKHFFETHDGDSLGGTAKAESGVEKGVGQKALLGAHVLHGETLPLTGNEVPVDALFVGEVEGGLRALGFIKAAQKGVGNLSHLGASLMGMTLWGERSGQAQRKGGKESKKCDHGATVHVPGTAILLRFEQENGASVVIFAVFPVGLGTDPSARFAKMLRFVGGSGALQAAVPRAARDLAQEIEVFLDVLPVPVAKSLGHTGYNECAPAFSPHDCTSQREVASGG